MGCDSGMESCWIEVPQGTRSEGLVSWHDAVFLQSLKNTCHAHLSSPR